MSDKPIPEIRADAQKACDRVGAAMKDRDFRTALDGLSVDVLECVDEFGRDNHDLIQQHLGDVDVSLLISAVVGWILGMPSGAHTAQSTNAEVRVAESFQHVVVAAYVASWSAENAASFVRSQQH